jgi:hypothetical protein
MSVPEYWKRYPKDVRKTAERPVIFAQSYRSDPTSTPLPRIEEIEVAIRALAASRDFIPDILDTLAYTLHILQKEGDHTSINRMIEMLGEPDYTMRSMLILLLEDIAGDQLVEALIPLLKEDKFTAERAAETLGKMKASTAAQPLIVAMNEEKISERDGLTALVLMEVPEVQALLDEYYAKPEHTWPQTINETIDFLLTELEPEVLDEIRQTPRDHVVGLYHMSLGMWLRNRLGLGGGNIRLVHECGGLDSPWPGDTSSGVILEALWDHLNLAANDVAP